MIRATAIVDLVGRLLTHEASERHDDESQMEAAERVSEKLRAHLSLRIGQEGFRTLLARALTLTSVQFPHLCAVRVASDGALVGLRAAGMDSEAAADAGTWNQTVEGAVALVSQLLGLLVALIGEDLTLRILHAGWPELPMGGENGTP